MHPVLTHVPPTRCRSTSATVWPAPVRRPASDGPAWPAPTTMASNRFTSRSTHPLAEVAREPILGRQAHDDRLGRARIGLRVPPAELRPQVARRHGVVV